MGYNPSPYPGGGTGELLVSPSGDKTGVTDATNINAAVTALPVSGGSVILAEGEWYVECGQVSINRSGVYLRGAGKWATFINAVGAGDVIRMYDSSTYTSRTVFGGGVLGITVDGTSTTGNSAGLHIGDILQLQLDVGVQNFTAGTTSIGVHFDNANYWTEQCQALIFALNCTAHVAFDVSGATTSTGSYERGNFQIYVDQTTASNNGVYFENGAFLADGKIGIYGNFVSSASALTSAVLTLTGSNPAGHPASNSLIENSEVYIGVECDTALAHAPATISFGASSNVISTCTGTLDFGLADAFAASNNSSNLLSFTGGVNGDSSLVPGVGFPVTLNLVNGACFGTYSGANSVSTGGTIANSGKYYWPLTNSGAVTGVILQAGFFDGQILFLSNKGTGSITFAAAGTSKVADGVTSVIAVNAGMTLIWNYGDSLWYRVTST